MSQPSFPPFVYAPVLLQDGEPRLAMNQLDDGRTAVFVYSAIDRMSTMYGADHAWVVTDADGLNKAHAETPFEVLLLDTTFERREPEVTPPASEPRREVFVAGSSPVAATKSEV